MCTFATLFVITSINKMTQKRRTGKYPFSRGRNNVRTTTDGTVNNSGNGEDDEIVNIMEVKEQAQDFFEKNQKLIIGVIAALALLVGGYFIYKYIIVAPKEKAAVAAMKQAQFQFAQDSFALALENPGGGELGFLDFIDEYSGTNAGNTAKYYAGISYLNLGKYDAALDYLNSYSPKDDITPAMKLGAIGDAHAELNDLDKALSMYIKAAGTSDNEFIGAYYLRKAALLSYKLGKNEDAVKYFKEILEKYPNAQEAREAEKFVERLG